jgi:hypothetical protein
VTANQNASVPIAKATIMTITAAHAAGELPWLATVPAGTMLLESSGVGRI